MSSTPAPIACRTDPPVLTDIYTSATITVVGFCVLWIVLVFAIAVNFVFAKRPYKFRGFACTIIALCIWTLIAGAAETWFFARSGTQLIVTIDGVRISQADVNAILLAAGIPLRYRSSIHCESPAIARRERELC